MLGPTFVYMLIPAIAIILGGLTAVYRTPSRRLTSIIQHFTAGVVLAAVMVELFPGLLEAFSLIPLVGGFSFGVATVLGSKWLVEELFSDKNQDGRNPINLMVVVGIDMFIDGLLIGISFILGVEVGIIITVALTLEVFFLALSASSTFTKAGMTRGRMIIISAVFASLFVVGAALGGILLGGLSGGLFIFVLAFATAALLYLVVEELLVEAHEQPETPLATAMFFAGFLLLVVLEGGVL